MQMPRAIGRANGTKELPRECFLSDSFTVGQWPKCTSVPHPCHITATSKGPKFENLYHFYQSLQARSRSKQRRRTWSPWLSQ